MAQVYRKINDWMAHLPGVKRQTREHGRAIAARARQRLAQHRDTGNSRIAERREDTDWIVELVDDGPRGGGGLSIEFGRAGYVRDDGTVVPPMDGLHVLRDSIRGA